MSGVTVVRGLGPLGVMCLLILLLAGMIMLVNLEDMASQHELPETAKNYLSQVWVAYGMLAIIPIMAVAIMLISLVSARRKNASR